MVFVMPRRYASGDAEAEIVVLFLRMVACAVGAAEIGWIRISPRATARHPLPAGLRTGRIIRRRHCIVVRRPPIAAPFRHHSMHVVQAKAVGQFRSHRLKSRAVGLILGVVTQLAVVRTAIHADAAGPARVFPFRFRG